MLVDGVSASPLPPPPVMSPNATPPPQRRHRTPSGSGKVDVQLRQNLNELDNLLDDLNHAQQQAALRAQTASPTSHKSVSPGPPEVIRGTRGIDSSLLEEPMDHSTPVNRHVTHTVRTYRYDTRYGGDDGPHDHNGPHHDGPPSGPPARQSLPRQIQSTPPPRDHYPSEPRHLQPTPPPQMTTTTVRTYSYGSPNAPPPQTPPSRSRSIPRAPVHDSPSPARQIHRPYPDEDDDDRDGPTDPLMPGAPRRTTTTTVRTYTYQLPGSTPNGPGEPIQPIPAPPPPSEPLTYNVTPRQPPLQVTELKPQPTPQTTVVTYKFTTSSGGPQPGIPEPNDRSPRPFPVDDNDAPASSQQPPKRLDELMASFSDPNNLEPRKHPESHPVSPVRYTVEEKVASNPPIVEGNGVGPKPAAPEGKAAPSPERTKTKNIAGPPVYYPPGVELFAKKDEPIHASMKESEGASKGESKSGGGGAAVVPVCLPLCCAMPCVIM
ncbi:hypothetical protein J437_LFUL003671 [Ladona fulva]|uniref:Uncharacterized protein n=1 Tax=Ladona fulva TaxID=123851 RepID=A0A8K0NXF7_LADFU|nr:hypothetical protein J437_LFUL003671 [Ladona fulva]